MDLLTDFYDAVRQADIGAGEPDIAHEVHHAPHRPPSALPGDCAATYVFSLSSSYGGTCSAGPNRVLKVGKVGAKSSARFCSQHYLPNSASSNLAKSLISERVLWPYLGIDQLDESNVRAWMLANLERDHFFVPAGHPGMERELERYLRGRLGPVFEG